jgi:hypothetical protein
MRDGWRRNASLRVEDGTSSELRNQSCQTFASIAWLGLTGLFRREANHEQNGTSNPRRKNPRRSPCLRYRCERVEKCDGYERETQHCADFAKSYPVVFGRHDFSGALWLHHRPGDPNGRTVVRAGVHGPKENKMSDDGRERAQLGAEVWKSSQM